MNQEFFDMQKQLYRMKREGDIHFSRGEIVIGNKHVNIMELSKAEVVNLQFDRLIKLIKENENNAQKGFASIVLSIDGYDDVLEELYEIDKVKRYFARLIKKVPHFLFYINPVNQMPFQIIGSLSKNLIKVGTSGSQELISELFLRDGHLGNNGRHTASFDLEPEIGYHMIDSINDYVKKSGFIDPDNELSILLKTIEWSITKNERREGWETRYN